MNRYINDILIWILPAVLLLVSMIPYEMPVFFPLILEIVVSITAAIIIYLLFTRKPKYFIFWGIAFILILLIFNPLLRLSIISGVVPLALIAAIIFLTNWWFVFRKRV